MTRYAWPLLALAALQCAALPVQAQDAQPTPPGAPAPAAAPATPPMQGMTRVAPTVPGGAPGFPAPGSAPVPVVSTPARDIGQLAWMHGCWSGSVNKRTFTEQWTAPAAGMMLGLGHTVLGDKTESFEFMRLETRPDGRIAYILRPTAKAEEAFVFEEVKSEPDVDFFIFSNPRSAFPTRIIYTHASGGRMYVHVQGTVNGADREVVYPFVPVDCGSGKPL